MLLLAVYLCFGFIQLNKGGCQVSIAVLPGCCILGNKENFCEYERVKQFHFIDKPKGGVTLQQQCATTASVRCIDIHMYTLYYIQCISSSL